jgi:hypothetical protein
MEWTATVKCPKCQKVSEHHDHYINSDGTIGIWCECGYKIRLRLSIRAEAIYMNEMGYMTGDKAEKFTIE